MNKTFMILIALVGMLPALMVVSRGRQAHAPPLKVIAGAVPKLWLGIVILAFALPTASLGSRLLLGVGALLAAVDLWNDVRVWRRKMRAAKLAPAGATAPGDRPREG